MIAQIDNVPAEWLKYFALAMLALLAVAGSVVGIVAALRRQRREVELDPPLPQPLSVQMKRDGVSSEDCHRQHADLGRRLEDHGREIESLWNTLRAENTAIRKEMTDHFGHIERALGRIEGKLND